MAPVEDSVSGMRAAHTSGMPAVAIPSRAHPPDAGALALAAEVPDGIRALTPVLVERGGGLGE